MVGSSEGISRRLLKGRGTASMVVSENRNSGSLRGPVLLAGIFLAGILLSTPLEPLVAQDGTVQGRVRDEEGVAVFRATVTLLRSGAAVLGSDTDRLGSFRILGVAPGPYTVLVQGLGYTEYSEDLVIGPTETVELDVRLQRSALQILSLIHISEPTRPY